MEYYLVHFDGRMGFQLARDADQAVVQTAHEFGYSYERASECYRQVEVDVQPLDKVALEDIIGFGGYIPMSVREHFGI